SFARATSITSGGDRPYPKRVAALPPLVDKNSRAGGWPRHRALRSIAASPALITWRSRATSGAPGGDAHGKENARHAYARPARDRPLAQFRHRPEEGGEREGLHGRRARPARDVLQGPQG